jgi:hypothetical protein
MMGGTASAGVAIVGIACRFPGAADHSAFWRNLCEGAESISALSDEDLLSARVPAELLRNPSYVKAAASLLDIAQFDASFVEYSPEEARLMDPQRRLLLEGEAPSDASDKDFNRGHRERYWGLPKSGEFGASCGDDILDILADLMTVL